MPAILEDEAIRRLVEVLKSFKVECGTEGDGNPRWIHLKPLQEWIEMLEKTLDGQTDKEPDPVPSSG